MRHVITRNTSCTLCDTILPVFVRKMGFITPLTTDDECTHHASLAACYQLAQSVLKIGFSLAKKVGWGRWVGSPRAAMHRAAALAGCRKALVGTGLAISLLFDTNGRR